MKKKLVAGLATSLMMVLSLGILQSVHAVNLLTNGSFESGTNFQPPTGWLAGPAGVEPIISPFGGSSLTIGSPDAGGNNAVYFSRDFGEQRLTQSVFLNPGNYEIGFDALAHVGNPGDASFTGTIAGITLASFQINNQTIGSTWFHIQGIANVSIAGIYQADFIFQGLGPGASKDALLDRVYIIETTATGGTPINAPIPEPSTMALLGIGLVGLIGVAVRKKKSGHPLNSKKSPNQAIE